MKGYTEYKESFTLRKSIRIKILLLFLSLLAIFVVCSILIYNVSQTTIYRLSEESVTKSMEQLNESMNNGAILIMLCGIPAS